jgi:hypothetical protein
MVMTMAQNDGIDLPRTKQNYEFLNKKLETRVKLGQYIRSIDSLLVKTARSHDFGVEI